MDADLDLLLISVYCTTDDLLPFPILWIFGAFMKPTSQTV